MADDNGSQPTPFGRSLKLVNGDLEIVNGDLSMISGRENFLQAIQVIIGTPYSTDAFRANYGFDLVNIISQPVSVGMMKELIHLNIVKSLVFDNRVVAVKEVAFSDQERFFELQGERDPEAMVTLMRRQEIKDRRLWRALIVVQTIESEEVTFIVEGAGA